MSTFAKTGGDNMLMESGVKALGSLQQHYSTDKKKAADFVACAVNSSAPCPPAIERAWLHRSGNNADFGPLCRKLLQILDPKGTLRGARFVGGAKEQQLASGGAGVAAKPPAMTYIVFSDAAGGAEAAQRAREEEEAAERERAEVAKQAREKEEAAQVAQAAQAAQRAREQEAEREQREAATRSMRAKAAAVERRRAEARAAAAAARPQREHTRDHDGGDYSEVEWDELDEPVVVVPQPTALDRRQILYNLTAKGLMKCVAEDKFELKARAIINRCVECLLVV